MLTRTKLKPRATKARMAFTLIELLVVKRESRWHRPKNPTQAREVTKTSQIDLAIA